MDHELSKVEELVTEIQMLRKEVEDLRTRVRELNGHDYTKSAELERYRARCRELEEKLGETKQTMKISERRFAIEVRRLSNMVRKADIFRDETKGTSKSKKERLMSEEMENIRRTNRVLLDFVHVLSKSFHFDPLLVSRLSEISSTVEDGPLKALVQELKEQKDEAGKRRCVETTRLSLCRQEE